MGESCFFTASDGVRVHYTIDDFAPPWKPHDTVVLLHAAMGSMNRMYGWVPILAAHYRVVRWDMRGHGRSQIPGEGGLSIDRLGRDVVELLDVLGLEHAHLAGSSAGGIVALYAAITAPARVKTLAGYATIPGLQSSAGHTDYTSWVRGLTTEGVKPFLRRTIATRFDLAQVDPGFVEWFLDDSARNDPAFPGAFRHADVARRLHRPPWRGALSLFVRAAGRRSAAHRGPLRRAAARAAAGDAAL